MIVSRYAWKLNVKAERKQKAWKLNDYNIGAAQELIQRERV